MNTSPENRHRLLVAEDDAASCFLVCDTLRKAGYIVIEARDGQVAWELFESEPGGVRAVVTDIMMPKMDGLELAEKVRGLVPDLPIVLLTGLDDKETIKKALRLGVNEFIEKPFNDLHLVERIAELLADSSSLWERERHRETAEAVRRAHDVLAAEQVEGLPLDVRYEPCTDAGGDVFRCQRREDGSLLFILADVAGHSVESSYALASFLGSFAAHSAGEEGLLGLLRKLNVEIRRGPFPDIAVCATVGQWCPWNGRLHLANAGLPHARHFRRTHDAMERITLDGTPLGYFPELLAEERVVVLQEGDRVLLGSDGLFDARSPEKALFDDDVDDRWQALRDVPIDEALESIGRAARAWAGGELADDLLLVGLLQPPWTRRSGELCLESASTLEEVDFLIDRLKKFPDSDESPFQLSKAKAYDVLAATREALSNAVLHGNAGRSTARIGLRCWRRSRSLHVAVTDEGAGFDLGAVVSSDDDLRDRGRGVSLMRRVSDGVSVIPGEVRLVFNLSGGRAINE